jgi:hypothetical protein
VRTIPGPAYISFRAFYPKPPEGATTTDPVRFVTQGREVLAFPFSSPTVRSDGEGVEYALSFVVDGRDRIRTRMGLSVFWPA